MKLGALLAWLLSAIPCAWPGLAAHLGGASLTALAALPWVAYAGLPRVLEDEASTAGEIGVLALALPPVVLGAWFDAAAGLAPRDVVSTLLGSLAFALVLSMAARSALRSSARQARHAVAWIALVAGAPLARAALELGGAPRFGQAPRALVLAARASPLDWLLERAAARPALPSGALASGGVPWLAILGALLLVGIAWAPERRTDDAANSAKKVSA